MFARKSAIRLWQLAVLLFSVAQSIRAAVVNPSDEPAFAETSKAIYQGLALSLAENQTTAGFFGVPYALPPVGRLRFAPPVAWQPPTAAEYEPDQQYSESDEVEAINSNEPGIEGSSSAVKPTIIANASKPACLQAPQESSGAELLAQSEDCLYLNIHSPVVNSGTSGTNRREYYPVLAWLHDGFLETGALTKPESPFGWELVVQQRLVIVEVAYRLGVFGFLRLPGDEGGGNWGLLDQQMALAWIRDSVAAFSGDAGRVTLAGSGAGAASAGLHLVNSQSAGLFHRVALLGGGPLAPWLFVSDSLSVVENITARLVRQVGCQRVNATDAVQCLRDVNAMRLAGAQPLAGRALDVAAFPVVADGRFIPDVSSGFFVRDISPKPALVGFTNREGEILARRAVGRRNSSELTGQRYQEVLAEAFQFYPAFPSRPRPTGRRLLSDSLTSFPSRSAALNNLRLLSHGLALWHTVCPANRLIDIVANSSAQPVFAYEFAEPDPGSSPAGGATHGQDAAYFTGEPFRNASYSQAQRDLSARMMSALAAFASNSSIPGWPAVTAGNNYLEILRLSAGAMELVADGISRQNCLFWDHQLAWVNQLDEQGGGCGGTGAPTSSRSPSTPSVTPDPDVEADFWARCNRVVNTVSIIAMSVGGGLSLLLCITLAVVASSKRRRNPPPPPRANTAAQRGGERRSADDGFADPVAMEMAQMSPGRRPAPKSALNGQQQRQIHPQGGAISPQWQMLQQQKQQQQQQRPAVDQNRPGFRPRKK